MSRPYTIRVDPDPLGATEAVAISVPALLMARSVTGNLVQWWNLNDQTYIGSVGGIDIENGFTTIDITDAGLAYFFGYYSVGLSLFSALYSVDSLGTVTRTDSPGPLFAGPLRVFDLGSGVTTLVGTAGCVGWSVETGYVKNNVVIAYAQRAMDFCLQGDGEVAGLFEPVGASNKFTIKSITGAAYSYEITGLVMRADTDSNIDNVSICHVSSENHWFVVTDGKFYLINDYNSGSPGTIKASGDFTALYFNINLPRKDPTATSFWAEFDLISSVTGEIILSVDPLDWVDEDTYVGVEYDVTSNALVSHPQINQVLVWRFLDSPPPDIGQTVLRTMTYTLDGHDYYCVRLGVDWTLVYDVYSEEWVEFTDADKTTWRARYGINWVGGQALAYTYGSNVIVGDDTLGVLWFLDPNQPYDDSPDPDAIVQQIYFPRILQAQAVVAGREVQPCYAVWLTTDMGAPAYLGAGVRLQISDDGGRSYTDMGTVTVRPSDNSPELAWYSLGQISAPGRLFLFTDDGAVTRIDSMEMNDPEKSS